jgi:hypothetical protein
MRGPRPVDSWLELALRLHSPRAARLSSLTVLQQV